MDSDVSDVEELPPAYSRVEMQGYRGDYYSHTSKSSPSDERRTAAHDGTQFPSPTRDRTRKKCPFAFIIILSIIVHCA